jgi:hypothetical protein
MRTHFVPWPHAHQSASSKLKTAQNDATHLNCCCVTVITAPASGLISSGVLGIQGPAVCGHACLQCKGKELKGISYASTSPLQTQTKCS